MLPASLAERCGLPRELPLASGTVRAALAGAVAGRAELARLLLDEGGDVRGYYSLFLNDEALRGLGGLEASLGEADVLFVLPPIAGGGGAGRPAAAEGDCPRPWADDLCRHAEEEYPREACGLLVAGPDGLRSFRVRNVAPRPTHRFELAPDEVLHLLRQTEGRLVAVYHSHPDGSPLLSQDDLEGADLWPGVRWIVVQVLAGRTATVRVFALSPAGAVEESDQGWASSRTP